MNERRGTNNQSGKAMSDLRKKEREQRDLKRQLQKKDEDTIHLVSTGCVDVLLSFDSEKYYIIWFWVSSVRLVYWVVTPFIQSTAIPWLGERSEGCIVGTQ